jgi:hypothetical protein
VRRIIELLDSFGMNEGRMDIGTIVHSSFTPSMASHAMAPSLIKTDTIGEGVDIGLTRVGTRRAQVNKDHASWAVFRSCQGSGLYTCAHVPPRLSSLIQIVISSLGSFSFQRLSRLNQETTRRISQRKIRRRGHQFVH